MDPSEKKLHDTSLVFPERIWCVWPELEYLDLADFEGSATKGFRKYLLRKKDLADSPEFISCLSDRVISIPTDDCRVLFQRAGHERYGPSISSYLSDSWRRNEIFLIYFKDLCKQPDILQSGEKAVYFVKIAKHFGVPQWNDTAPEVVVDFETVCVPILKGLRKMRSKHPLLVIDFIKMVCNTERARRRLFTEVPDREHLEFLLDAANETKFNFWGIREGLLNQIIFELVVKRGRYDLVTTLIRYGFSIQKMQPRPVQYKLSYSIADTNPPDWITFTVKETESAQFFLFTLAVFHIAAHNYEATREFCDMYRKLVLSLPYPRESLAAVNKWFLLFFNTIPVDIDLIKEQYMESPMHPESRVLGEPVKLSELCRCVVRERLRDNFQLPHGVHGMKIPKLIKAFLTFNDPSLE